MRIVFHPHALERMDERGASRAEVRQTVLSGELFVVKYGRYGYRKNFVLAERDPLKHYRAKQIEVIGVKEGERLVVVTVVAKYF